MNESAKLATHVLFGSRARMTKIMGGGSGHVGDLLGSQLLVLPMLAALAEMDGEA